MTVGAFLREASEQIPAKEVIWLLTSLLKINHGELLLARERELSGAQLSKLGSWLERRAQGEPLQYIVGHTSFWGRDFKVGRGILIPRPETEVLVAIALREIDCVSAKKIFDVGVGSGCIGLTLLCERPGILLAGSDINEGAVALAGQNARLLGVADRARFYSSSFLRAVRKYPPDLVVANPPYLDLKKDKVSGEVKDWEPGDALFSGQAGAGHAEQIFAECLRIKPRMLVMELSPRVAATLQNKWKKEKKVKSIRRESDLTGRQRFLIVEFKHG